MEKTFDMPVKKPLTDNEIKFIKKNRLKMSSGDIAIALGRGDRIIQMFLIDNGLKVPKTVWLKLRQQKLKGRTILTEQEDEFLKENYLALPVKFMADILDRGDGLIQRRVKQLGLIIPDWIIEKRKLESRIQPGNVPVNKGKKQTEFMSAEAIERTKATRFKKGGLPPTTLYDGCITIRKDHPERNGKPHKYIRISKSKWQELQIYNWEKKNGKVPKGFILACKDGDTLNCKPSNWYLMSKADNMHRNSSSVNLKDGFIAFTIAGKNHLDLISVIKQDKKLIEIKRQSLLLNRTINERTANTAKA